MSEPSKYRVGEKLGIELLPKDLKRERISNFFLTKQTKLGNQYLTQTVKPFNRATKVSTKRE